MMLTNQSDFAALHKVSRKTVTKWKGRGWIIFQGNKVDVDASNTLLKKYRPKGIEKAVTSDSSGNKKGNKKISEETPAKDSNLDETSQDDLSKLSRSEIDRLLQTQKLEIAKYEARQAKWDADIREGRLLDADEVERIDSTRCIGLRNKLLSIPSEQALKLANCNDPAQVAEILRDAITDALNDFLREYGIDQ